MESPAHNGPSSPKAHASPAGAPPRADIPQSAAQLPPSLTSRQFNKLRAMAARPEDFDLAAPVEDGNRLGLEKVERLTDLLFAPLHLRAIFLDPAALLRFTSFLAAHRPQSLPTLVYFLDATKAIKAIDYANAVAHALEAVDDPELDAEDENGDSEDGRGSASISKPLAPIKEVTANNELRAQAERAFDLLVRLDLPAYTAYMFTQVIKARTIIPLNRAPKIDENFQGFAEVFCLTDPRRTDNPIIFASPGKGSPLGSVMVPLQGPSGMPSDESIMSYSLSPDDAVQHELHHWSQLSLPARSTHQPREPQAHQTRARFQRAALGGLCQLVSAVVNCSFCISLSDCQSPRFH